MYFKDLSVAPQRIHPALWRASQLARMPGRCVDTGFPALSAQLPGGGWPLGNLIELLIQQPGIGEMQLLRPALSDLSSRRSEEHTSELQSLMRISYAVFCLKKKKIIQVKNKTNIKLTRIITIQTNTFKIIYNNQYYV